MHDLFESVWGQRNEIYVKHMVEITHSVSFHSIYNPVSEYMSRLLTSRRLDRSICHRTSWLWKAGWLERYADSTKWT